MSKFCGATDRASAPEARSTAPEGDSDPPALDAAGSDLSEFDARDSDLPEFDTGGLLSISSIARVSDAVENTSDPAVELDGCRELKLPFKGLMDFKPPDRGEEDVPFCSRIEELGADALLLVAETSVFCGGVSFAKPAVDEASERPLTKGGVR